MQLNEHWQNDIGRRVLGPSNIYVIRRREAHDQIVSCWSGKISFEIEGDVVEAVMDTNHQKMNYHNDDHITPTMPSKG